MPWNENYTALNYILADLYNDKEETKGLVKRAWLNGGLISFKDQSYTNWFNIIDGADKQGKVVALLDTILAPNERGGSADASIQQTLKAIRDNIINGQVAIRITNASASREDEDIPGNFEKLMGDKSTLLPISFLEKGLICSTAVVRINLGKHLGTGFLINDNWIVTNNHVLPDKARAADAAIEFNYQKNIAGLDAKIERYQLLTHNDCFHTNTEEDWTIVKLNRDANTTYGALTLSGAKVAKGDFVNIIQHPEGGPKQIALYHNAVTSVTDMYVQYLTDTLPGSSGSPVFNSQWEVVALHHWGGNTRERYSLFSVYRNRGINITKVKNALTALKIK